MQIKNFRSWSRQYLQQVDWDVLVFLVLFLNVKLAVKLLAVGFILIRKGIRSFRFSGKSGGIPLFYPLMILVALIDLFLYGLYRESNYLFLITAGIGSWLLCMIAFRQVGVLVDAQAITKLHATLVLFFLLNAVASFGNLLAIIWETGAINPYRYQGNYQKYFIGTGDYIRGISFNTSTTNAIMNAFGIVYFLNRKNFVLSLFCMVVLLLTYSNFANLIVVAVLVWMFLFSSDRNQKSIIVIQFALLVIFMTNISPQNNRYASEIMAGFMSPGNRVVKHTKPVPVEERADSLLNPEEKKYKIARLWLDSVKRVRSAEASIKETVKPDIPRANIHTPEYQHRQDSSETRMTAISYLADIKKEAAAYVDTSFLQSRKPGKLLAFRQLWGWMHANPSKLVTGNGLGNFSSKLAFRAAGIKTAGSYPERFRYVNEDFRHGALFLYLDYFARDSGYHSVANLPYSFYVQLVGEYGIAGCLCFLIGYLGYFARRCRRSSYAIPILLIMVAAFAVDYWFEQLSVVLLFELFLLIDLKEKQQTV
jgi:hypothetical protein